VAATGAGAENTYFAVVISLPADPLHRSVGITDHLGVRNTALCAHFSGYVVRITLASTFIEVSTDREIAVMRKTTGRLNVELAPAREMVDKHHAWEYARTRWLGHVVMGVP
jgi:hypothetical protein